MEKLQTRSEEFRETHLFPSDVDRAITAINVIVDLGRHLEESIHQPADRQIVPLDYSSRCERDEKGRKLAARVPEKPRANDRQISRRISRRFYPL